MLVELKINLFNGDHVTTFKEEEYELPTYPRKSFSKEIAISHFSEVISKYEKKIFPEKLSYELIEKEKKINLSYFTKNNDMEYYMIISY